MSKLHVTTAFIAGLAVGALTFTMWTKHHMELVLRDVVQESLAAGRKMVWVQAEERGYGRLMTPPDRGDGSTPKPLFIWGVPPEG